MQRDNMVFIKSPKDLENPFYVFCAFLRYSNEAEEDYLDYNDSIANPVSFIKWLLAKEYIDKKIADTLLSDSFLYMQRVLQDQEVFPKTYGSSRLGYFKSYALLAEYISASPELHQEVFDTFYADWFYKDDNGISLACIIDEEQLAGDPVDKDSIKSESELWNLTYYQQYTLACSMSIIECDNFLSNDDDIFFDDDGCEE